MAPIFDNGKSLFNGNFSVKEGLPLEENVKRVISRPFRGTHQSVMEYFGRGFDVDRKRALAWLEGQPESRAKEVLKYQIWRLEDK